jgi:hypothetical protein
MCSTQIEARDRFKSRVELALIILIVELCLTLQICRQKPLFLVTDEVIITSVFWESNCPIRCWEPDLA